MLSDILKLGTTCSAFCVSGCTFVLVKQATCAPAAPRALHHAGVRAPAGPQASVFVLLYQESK